ncbi:MAG: agmatine deiminase family protein [Chloroflexota bacterium]
MTQRGSNRFLQFNYIPYPLWRRKLPPGISIAAHALLQRHYPVVVDRTIPTLNEVMGYLRRFNLMADIDADTLTRYVDHVVVTDPAREPVETDDAIRLPAQWEPIERVMLSWPIAFPPLWPTHMQMTEAIAPVATVQVNVPHPLWGAAVLAYLAEQSTVDLEHVTIYHLPTDDIWVRDYGPFVGFTSEGNRAVVSMTYDPLPNYPQTNDNAMPARWAAYEGLPLHRMAFHGEGGNMWSDGAGTLLMTNQAYILNPAMRHDTLLETLHKAFNFEKLVLVPRLRVEETGHIDLLVKMASADTLLVSAPDGLFTADRLRAARSQLLRARNAAGDRYQIIPLPTPPLYFNWFGFPIRRSYTNALTVNGRVLVPVYGLHSDEVALRTYEQAMPGYTIHPIDCTVTANGGGAVHCLTKEVPAI